MNSSLPIIFRSKSWLKSRNWLSLTDERLKKIPTDDKGRYAVSIEADSLIESLDVHRRLERIEKALGISKGDITSIGDSLYSLINKLMSGNLSLETRKHVRDFEYLCDLLSDISLIDFQILKDFWALRYTPKKIEQALYVTAKTSTLPGLPKNLTTALTNMALLSDGPRFEIPTSH